MDASWRPEQKAGGGEAQHRPGAGPGEEGGGLTLLQGLAHLGQVGLAHDEEERLAGLQGLYASPAAAKDRIYIIGRNGTTAVIKNSAKLEILATNELGEKVDASPALVGRELFVRGHEHLFCIAH